MDAAPSPGRADAALVERLWRDRRWLHACAEPGYQEHETSDFVRRRLDALGIAHVHGLAGTGVVATLQGRGTGRRTIGLRADMDALPMAEGNDFAHRARRNDAFHGCGHDGHTTIRGLLVFSAISDGTQS